jgi:hypothetical protein
MMAVMMMMLRMSLPPSFPSFLPSCLRSLSGSLPLGFALPGLLSLFRSLRSTQPQGNGTLMGRM